MTKLTSSSPATASSSEASMTPLKASISERSCIPLAPRRRAQTPRPSRTRLHAPAATACAGGARRPPSARVDLGRHRGVDERGRGDGHGPRSRAGRGRRCEGGRDPKPGAGRGLRNLLCPGLGLRRGLGLCLGLGTYRRLRFRARLGRMPLRELDVLGAGRRVVQ